MNMKFLLLLALTIVVGSFALQSGSVLAHEDRELAGLQIELGFNVEPPIEGLPNGIVIIATKEGEAEEHEHDDMAMGGDMAMGASPTVDVETHGELFGSGTITPGATFEFEATHELENLVVPFHNHLNHDAKGEIHVMDSAPAADTFTIEIGHDGFYEPATAMVQPGTTLVFSNVDEEAQTVVSGLAGGAESGDNAHGIWRIQGAESGSGFRQSRSLPGGSNPYCHWSVLRATVRHRWRRTGRHHVRVRPRYVRRCCSSDFAPVPKRDTIRPRT